METIRAARVMRIATSLAIFVAVAGCATGAQPTPIIIYVTPEPVALATAAPPSLPLVTPVTPSAFARYEAFTEAVVAITPRIAPMIAQVADGTVNAADLEALKAHHRWLESNPAQACYLDVYQHWKIAMSSFILGFEYSRAGDRETAAHWLNEAMPWFTKVELEGPAAASTCAAAS